MCAQRGDAEGHSTHAHGLLVSILDAQFDFGHEIEEYMITSDETQKMVNGQFDPMKRRRGT